MLKPRYQFEADCIHAAIKGIGTNNKVQHFRKKSKFSLFTKLKTKHIKVVIEFLCSKDANEINILKQAYQTCNFTILKIQNFKWNVKFFYQRHR